MLEFLQDNTYKLIFTGVASIIIGVIYQFIANKNKSKKNSEGQLVSGISPITNENTNTNNNIFSPVINVSTPLSLLGSTELDSSGSQSDNLEKRKVLTRILFIDDDAKFKVVNILRKSGWINIKAIKDVKNIDDPLVRDTDIFFVDIQGVGKALSCKDEGLGLALNLKQKYPQKKLVLYSAENKGDRFHEALRKADSSLAKNAEPLEFQALVEQFSKEIYPND